MTIKLSETVWTFRKDYEKYWPTPNKLDSLRFAFTEIAEAIDADLRGNITYRRNNQRNPSVEEELADCAIMLITSLPNVEVSDYIWGSTPPHASGTLERIAKYVTRALFRKHLPSKTIYEIDVYTALWYIVDYVGGYDVLQRLIKQRLARIYNKHVRSKIQDNPLPWSGL